MRKSKNIALGLVVFGICASVAACSSSQKSEGGTSASEVTSARQLGGAGMPQGSFALTFDDGPGARTEEMANWLGDRGIVATFFINGKNAPNHDGALRAIQARGHLLANHTQNHDDMAQQSGNELYRAVADTDAIIARYQPSGPWLLRPPYGSWSARVSGEVNDTDLGKYVGPIFWDVGGELTATHAADWACWGQALAVDDCAQRYMNEMRENGRGIILMHDVHPQTVEMTKLIVETMKGSVKFVALTEVPSIRTALGLQSTGGGTSGDGPAPGTGEECGSVTYAGFCDKNTLTWCKDNVLTKADCTAKGKVCNLTDPVTGSDCALPIPCGDVDYKGSCNGDVLTWCDDAGALRHNDCVSKGKTCGLESEASGYNCR